MPTRRRPHFVARPGGNALNVAVAAGRLGTPVRLLARLGTGPLGANLRRHAELSGVDGAGFVPAAEPVSLAVIGLKPDGSPDYGFHVLGAADWQWTDAELAAVYPERTAILHVGSISSWTAPGSDAIARLVERVAGSALDQRRPEHPSAARRRPGRRESRQRPRRSSASGSTGWCAGPTSSRSAPRTSSGSSPTCTAPTGWTPPRSAGPTAARPWSCSPTAADRCGSPARGARCVHREPVRVTVADTVGAGDSLAAGLLSGLLAAGVTTRAALEALPDDDLLRVVDDAALVAAINCTRVGADPPTRAELDAARAAR